MIAFPPGSADRSTLAMLTALHESTTTNVVAVADLTISDIAPGRYLLRGMLVHQGGTADDGKFKVTLESGTATAGFVTDIDSLTASPKALGATTTLAGNDAPRSANFSGYLLVTETASVAISHAKSANGTGTNAELHEGSWLRIEKAS